MKKNILMTSFIVLASLTLVGCAAKDSNKLDNNAESTYAFSYKGVDVTPGEYFKSSAIDEEAAYAELESCAFEGNDKVYTYESVEITASAMNGKDKVYSVYFLNDSVETTEGVKIADDKTKMIEKYGNNYKNINNEYTYTSSDVILSFIVENDTIVSIEYIYNSDNK